MKLGLITNKCAKEKGLGWDFAISLLELKDPLFCVW